jgi:UrcA family protein
MKLNRAMFATVIAALTALSPALAADDMRFAYRTQELETPEGRTALLERIEGKARSECRIVPILPPHYGSARTACEGSIFGELVAKIDDARLNTAARDRLDRHQQLMVTR